MHSKFPQTWKHRQLPQYLIGNVDFIGARLWFDYDLAAPLSGVDGLTGWVRDEGYRCGLKDVRLKFYRPELYTDGIIGRAHSDAL